MKGKGGGNRNKRKESQEEDEETDASRKAVKKDLGKASIITSEKARANGAGRSPEIRNLEILH